MASVLRRASILSVKTSLVAVGCGVLLLGAVSAHVGESLHGIILQGVQLHGIALNGVACTGISRLGVAISRSNPWGERSRTRGGDVERPIRAGETEPLPVGLNERAMLQSVVPPRTIEQKGAA